MLTNAVTAVVGPDREEWTNHENRQQAMER